MIDHTKLPPAKGPTDRFTIAKRATTKKFIEDARYGVGTQTNGNTVFSGQTYSKCVKPASTRSSITAQKNLIATTKDILRR